MACRDVLEMTQDYDRSALELWDQLLSSQDAPTLSEMRARHWKLVAKILKRGRIKDEDEFYLVKESVDRMDIKESGRAQMVPLLDAFEAASPGEPNKLTLSLSSP